MSFVLPQYRAPDFTRPMFREAPSVTFLPAPRDGVAPEGYHATSIFPEYFKVDGRWLLAEESRMDCVAALREGKIAVVEFRNLKQGEPVAVGRTEDASQGIYIHADGFGEDKGEQETFSFRQGRSRETAYSMDYDSIYELLRYEKEHGRILWVMGPACAFDHDARDAFAALVRAGYVHGLLAGNALPGHPRFGGGLSPHRPGPGYLHPEEPAQRPLQPHRHPQRCPAGGFHRRLHPVRPGEGRHHL